MVQRTECVAAPILSELKGCHFSGCCSAAFPVRSPETLILMFPGCTVTCELCSWWNLKHRIATVSRWGQIESWAQRSVFSVCTPPRTVVQLSYDWDYGLDTDVIIWSPSCLFFECHDVEFALYSNSDSSLSSHMLKEHPDWSFLTPSSHLHQSSQAGGTGTPWLLNLVQKQKTYTKYVSKMMK